MDLRDGIVPGYRAGAIGRCVAMHAHFYADHAGFGRVFEAKVAGDLAEFMGRLDAPANGFWSALHEGEIAGTIAIDGEDLGPGVAHLRWFIVGDGARGTGLGAALLDAALGFCDEAGIREIRLWTFAGLDAARRLYESRGFRLIEEQPGETWGTRVTEQQFVREKPQTQKSLPSPAGF